MPKPPRKKPPNEDPDQSDRFMLLARELEADGTLNPTDVEQRFRATFEHMVPEKKAAERSSAAEGIDPKPDRKRQPG